MRQHPVSAITIRRYLDRGLKFTSFYSPEDSDVFARVARQVALAKSSPSLILDLGCGTGIPLIHAVGRVHYGIGVDIDGNAIDVAVRNADRLGRRNLTFVCADMMNVRGKFALVMSNPPYIPAPSERVIDPALEVHGDGTAVIQRILTQYKDDTNDFVIHFASICDPPVICERAKHLGFGLNFVEFTAVAFGRYTSQEDRLRYLLERRASGSAFFHGPVADKRDARYLQLLMTAHFVRQSLNARDLARTNDTVPPIRSLLQNFQDSGLRGLVKVASRIGSLKLRLGIYADANNNRN